MMHSKRHLPDIEQWSRIVAPTSSRGGLVLALLAQGLIVAGLVKGQQRTELWQRHSLRRDHANHPCFRRFMYPYPTHCFQSIGLRKSTPPQNRQDDISISTSQQHVDFFVGGFTFCKTNSLIISLRNPSVPQFSEPRLVP